MTQRRQQDLEPMPPPSFDSLPDIAHTTIASFLPDGNARYETNRAVVLQVSRALLDPYGGSLTHTEFRNFAGSRVDNLAGLMRRNKSLLT